MSFLAIMRKNFWANWISVREHRSNQKNQKAWYRVLWAPIGNPGKQNKEPPFEAHNNDEARDLFVRGYQQNQRYAGDILTLQKITKPEEVQVIATVTIHVADGDPL